MTFSLEVKQYSFSYVRPGENEKKALNKIDFTVEPGTLIAVIGLSGCGKSTLCKALSGLIPHCFSGHTEGQILVGGESTENLPLSQLSQRVGLVMQNPDDQLIATTVEDEFAFSLENLIIPPNEIKERVEKMLFFLGLEPYRMQDPNRLSGGQKQLTAFGSVLILCPDILVLDEPASHLDEAGKKMLFPFLKSLAHEGKTVILVGHEPLDLMAADKWLVLEDGEVSAFAPPDVVLSSCLKMFGEKTRMLFETAV